MEAGFREGKYKKNTYGIQYIGDGRARFYINGTTRFFGCEKACEYFYKLAEQRPEIITWENDKPKSSK